MNVEGVFAGEHSFIVPPRLEAQELLDLGLGSDSEVRANLREMDRINRLLGGLPAVTRHLYPRLLAHGGPLTLLDLATGSAGIPCAILRWARKRHLQVQILALDRSQRNLRQAAAMHGPAPGLHLLSADALAPPFPSGRIDYIISSLFLHHLRPGQVIDLLGWCAARAACGLVLSDLTRGWLPYWAFLLGRPVFARNWLTRHDGALSVRRAYTPAELASLARAAGLEGFRIYTHFPWRMTLVLDR